MDSYTENDFNSLYQTVRRELVQKANYDILKDNKYRTVWEYVCDYKNIVFESNFNGTMDRKDTTIFT